MMNLKEKENFKIWNEIQKNISEPYIMAFYSNDGFINFDEYLKNIEFISKTYNIKAFLVNIDDPGGLKNIIVKKIPQTVLYLQKQNSTYYISDKSITFKSTFSLIAFYSAVENYCIRENLGTNILDKFVSDDLKEKFRRGF